MAVLTVCRQNRTVLQKPKPTETESLIQKPKFRLLNQTFGFVSAQPLVAKLQRMCSRKKKTLKKLGKFLCTKVTIFSLDMSKYPLCTECLFITIVCCQILWKVSKFESARPRQLSAIEVDALWGFYQVKSFVVFYSEGCNVSVLCSLSGTLEVPLWTESVL